MKSLNMTAKIWLSIGVFVIGFVFSTLLGQIQGRNTERDLTIASEALFPAAQESQEAESGMQQAIKSFGDAVITQDASAVERGSQEGSGAIRNIKAVAAIPELSADRLAAVRALLAELSDFVPEAKNTYGAIAGNPSAMTPEMQARIRELATKTEQIKADLKKTKEGLSSDLHENLNATRAASVHQRWLAIALFVSTLAIASVIVTLTIRRSITGPILHVIRGVQQSADQAAGASAHMAQSGQVVARDAQEQAACLQETSASLNEISAATSQNCERAVDGDALMAEAKATVQKATEAMENVTASMGEISTSSREVSGVLKSLDEISFNTNILALNAAVEAARAGEAGAGFSVVADEVRSLAKRAAEAARHSAEIIEKTIDDVSKGVKYVALAREAFQEASGKITRGSEVMGQIAQSSEKQARDIQTIGQAISRMEQVTQNNASNAQATARNAESMSSQVETTRKHLVDLIAVVGIDPA